MKVSTAALAFSILLLAGCGGSQSGADSDSGTPHTTSVGTAMVSYSGKVVPAALFSSNGVTVAAMAGASFSTVQLNPAPKKENSAILFTVGMQVFSLQNGVKTQLTSSLGNKAFPAVSKYGLVVYAQYVPAQGQYELFTCNLDGSALHQITFSLRAHFYPSWSSSGSKLVFSDNNGSLWTVNASGSGETQLAITAPNMLPFTCISPSWSADSTKIAFAAQDTTTTLNAIFTVPAAGGTATEVASYPTISASNPHWSPNGSTLIYEANSSPQRIDAVDLTSLEIYNVGAPPADTNYSSPSFSPDGLTFAFDSYTSSIQSINTEVIGERSSLTPVVSYNPSVTSVYYPNWSPFFAPKAFIGSGGEMPTAAGFIWSQLGDGFGAFVSIAATTPSTLKLTQQTPGTAGGPAVYLAKADKITKIVYTNSYFGAYNAVTPASSTQALISISTVTGQVDTVAPFTETANQTVPSKGSFNYDAKFTGIFDRHGKNLAPSGANHIELDSKSGALKSWR